MMAEMSANVKDVAMAIRETGAQWNELVGVRIYEFVSDFSQDFLDRVYTELYGNEMEAKRFLAMPVASRKAVLEKKLADENRRADDDDDN